MTGHASMPFMATQSLLIVPLKRKGIVHACGGARSAEKKSVGDHRQSHMIADLSTRGDTRHPGAIFRPEHRPIGHPEALNAGQQSSRKQLIGHLARRPIARTLGWTLRKQQLRASTEEWHERVISNYLRAEVLC